MAVIFNQNLYVFGGKGIDDNIVSSIEVLPYFPVTSATERTSILKKFELFSCYPNPFNPSTNISFSVPNGRNVNLTVYSVIGEKIRTVTSGFHNPGIYHVTWHGKDDHGNNASSGVYFFNLSDGTNLFIAEKEPWNLAKENKDTALQEVLFFAYDSLKLLSEKLEPFMPETAKRMKKQLETLEPEPLFPRLNEEK
jgi:hypothetical protein